MKISQEDLAELQRLYAQKYGIALNDDETKELARRLTVLFSVVGKKIPEAKT